VRPVGDGRQGEERAAGGAVGSRATTNRGGRRCSRRARGGARGWKSQPAATAGGRNPSSIPC
jgi:hypothetical protein